MRALVPILPPLALTAALATLAVAAPPGAPIAAAESSGAAAVPAAAHDPWLAVAASGRVEVVVAGQPPETWSPVRRGDRLAPAGLVRSGPRGRATLTRGDDILLVDPDSELVLPADGAAATLLQHRGNVLYEVHREPDVHFQVVTPYLVAGVKGTVFGVLVQDDYTSVTVSRGHVEVHATITNERADLFTGDMAVLSGPMGRLEVHRDPRDRMQAARMEEGDAARRTRKDAGKLVRLATEDDLGEEVLYDFSTRDFVYFDDAEWKRLGDELDASFSEALDLAWRDESSLDGLLEETKTLLGIEERQNDTTSASSSGNRGLLGILP